MLYIDPNAPNVFIARTAHSRTLECFVKIRIGQSGCGDKKNCHICRYFTKSVKNLRPKISRFLNQGDNLSKLLSGLPKDLERLNRAFWLTVFPWKPYEELIPYMGNIGEEAMKKKSELFKRYYKLAQIYVDQLNEIFDYEWFGKKESQPFNGYDLSRLLDRYTCSYCNRSFTSTVITKDKKPVIRPTLDHWFPKSTYPLLAVSFHNLVPSCYPCNSSIRGVAEMTLEKNVHPYQDANQAGDFEFDYSYTALDGYQIQINDTVSGIKDKSRAKNTLVSMQMYEIYNSNVSELRDLIMIQRNYSLKYIKTMQKQLNTRLNKGDVYRILFGTSYEQENYHKRPLSKFKKDILKKLGMLDDL